MNESAPSLQPRNEAAYVVGIVASEIPDMPTKLGSQEKKIWHHVTKALKQYDLIHLTDGLMLSIISKTYVKWVNAETELEAYAAANGGSYMVETPNGYVQPHQLFHVAGRLNKQLMEWLPEAALTIPSFNKMIHDRAMPEQGKLNFSDPVERHRDNKTKIGLVGIDGGKASAT